MNSSELSAVQEAPLYPQNGSNGHPGGHLPSPASGEEDTFVFPASREQSRYWMLAQLDPKSTASNMAISFDIDGALDASAAESAIAALTLRHEALRTIFRLESGVLSQVVLERPLYRFSFEDLGHKPAAERDTAAAAAVNRHGHTQINLHTGPVLHALLIRLDERRHIMALTMNHIVCDGWSNGILIRDFTLLYEAIRARREAVLPDLPFQFADFSLWQNEYLESPAAEEASAFWKSHITAEMPALDMPTDFPRTSGRSFPGHIESALLPKEIDDRLKEYCRTSGSTKHIVLLAAFQALCARYTGQTEFLLGSTIANRTQPGMEDVVGRFANPQIIVAKVDGDPTFAALELRVREWETAAYLHQDLPFSRIIEDFQIDQAGATSQFLQVWFLYQKAFMQPQQGETIRVTPRRSVSGGVDFDLLVSIVERAEGPRIQMEYNTQLFTPERVRGLISSFTQLLGDGLLDPAMPVSRIAMAEVPAATPAYDTVSIMDTHHASIEPQSLADRIRDRASRIPAEIATVDGVRSLTWRQLDVQSDAVAEVLQKRGTAAHSTVAVHLAPRVESTVALLAALKTGARVLPLPGHGSPDGVASLLNRVDDVLLLAPVSFSPAVAYEDFSNLPQALNHASPPSGPLLFLVDAASAAFASVSSPTVVHSIEAVLKATDMQMGESLLVFPTDSPTDACLDVLMAFAGGAQLCFAGAGQPHSVESQLAQYQITRLVLGAVDLKRLTAANWQGDRRVSLVLRGGRLPAPLTGRENKLLPRNVRSALYLLSVPQAGGYAGYQVLAPQASHGLLGLNGTTLQVHGPNGRQPNGAFGELQTAEGIPLNYMARSATDGSIELLDRAERFLPLRGHRVCLGDIEDALLLLPHVADSHVTVLDTGAAQQLIAYLTAEHTGDHGPESIREQLGSALPSHLVPSECLSVDALPRMLDGQVDGESLLYTKAAPPAALAAESAVELTPVEEKLTGIWREVLGVRQIDKHRSFFDLGGSSLLLVRLFARINKAFSTSLPITTIFDAQTIAELAPMLGGASAISPLVQVNAHGSHPPLFMIHSYLLYKGLSTALGTDQPFYGLRELERDGNLTIDERVKGYVREIRRVQPQGPYYLAGWCAAGPLTVEVSRQLLLNDQQVNYVGLFDSWLPGYLESIESSNGEKSWLPYRTVSSKLAFHRSKMRGLTGGKKLHYLWLASARIVKEVKYSIYLRNWERLRNLSERFHFALPQFMHNTSLNTFSALKDYREKGLPIHINLIRASDSREIPGAAASCGWERVAERGVEVTWAPGNHETMFIGENLAVTASILRRDLLAAQAVSGEDGFLTTGADVSAVRGTAIHVDCPST